MILRKVVLLLFFLPAFENAQKVLKFSNEIEKMRIGGWHYNIDKVIDAREVSAPNFIGNVQTGLVNSKRDAVLKRPLAEELLPVVMQLLPEVDDTIELILKVNRMKVWEQTYFSTEEAYAFADFDLILKKDSSFYRIDGYSDFIKYRSGWDVTGKHMSNIETILRAALIHFERKKAWTLPDSSLQKLDFENLTKISKPQILSEEKTKIGIYKHFGEFLTRNPTIPYLFEEKKGKKILVLTDNKGNKVSIKHPTDVWGFYDGEQIYICQEGSFFPVEITKKGIIKFKGYNVQKKTRDMQTGAILGGLIGAAIASSITYDLEWMEINMNSGQVLPLKDSEK